MAKMFFFTDVNLLSNQTAIEAFGPKADANDKNRYQVTSLHTATADPSAYAVCNGIVCIQPQIGSSELVNLVLKPLAQPPFDFPKIKYIIYRGIKADSLIDGDDIQDAGTNDLTNTIHTSFNALKTSSGISGNPPKEALGIHFTGTGYENADPVDYLFYREDENIQFPLVVGGWKMGTFAKQGFGIDLITESLGFEPVLLAVREAMHIIEIDKLPGSPSQPEVFEHWHDKETILNFIDPSAFFGSFFNHGLSVKSSIGSEIVNKMKNDLYDDVLSKFANKNVVYLDIRNEYNYSFNYFGNYGEDIKLAFSIAQTPGLVNFYSSGWPIRTLHNGDFPTGNSSDKNVIKLAMPDGNGDNPLPMIYLATGYLNSEYPRETKGANKMLDVGLQNDFTDELSFAIPNRSGATTVVSSYIKLKYNKRFDEANPPLASSGTVIRAQNFLDNIFAPFDTKIPFAGIAKIRSVVYDEDLFIDAAKGTLSRQYIVSVGFSEDVSNVNFFCFPKTVKQLFAGKTNLQEGILFSGETNNTYDDFTDLAAGRLNVVSRKSEFLLDPGPDVQYLEFVKKDLAISPLDLQGAEKDDFFNIAIDNTPPNESEWNTLSQIASSNFLPGYRVFLGFINETYNTDENGFSYITFDIVLRGFHINQGELEVKEINTNIKIFSPYAGEF